MLFEQAFDQGKLEASLLGPGQARLRLSGWPAAEPVDIVSVARGQSPNVGRFCGNCYTPIARDTELCPHCRNDVRTARKPVDAVPGELLDVLRVQRSIESKWVNGFAYLGILIAAVTGITIVLSVPFFRDSLIWATVFYGIYLLIGSRVLPAILGGYYGDRIGFEKAREKTREAWDEWLAERDRPKRATNG